MRDPDTAELIQVIRTSLLRRGKGVAGDPVRIITQYWSTNGELLAEVDPWPGASPMPDPNYIGEFGPTLSGLLGEK